LILNGILIVFHFEHQGAKAASRIFKLFLSEGKMRLVKNKNEASYLVQGSYGHGKPGKVMDFLNGYFQAWKSHGKNLNHKSFGKVMKICYNRNNMFFLKKDAQEISRRTLSIRKTF